MYKKRLLVTFAAACMSFSALALSVAEAKSQGLVGETSNGYLAAVKGDAKAQRLVSDINKKRKSKYQQLAKKNGISLSQVEALAGKKAQEKTASGHFIKVNGQWVKK